jgi:hypothetical protein
MIEKNTISNYTEEKTIIHTTYRIGNKTYNVTILSNSPSDEALGNLAKAILRDCI